MPEAHKHEGDQDQIRVDRYLALLRQTPHGLDLSMKLYDQQIMRFFSTGMVLVSKFAHRALITVIPAGLVAQLLRLLNIRLIIQQVIASVINSDLFETWLALVFVDKLRTILTISEVVNQDVESYVKEYESLGDAIDKHMQTENQLTQENIREALGLNEDNDLQESIDGLVNAANALKASNIALVTSENALNENKTNPNLVKTYEGCLKEMNAKNQEYERCLETVIGANNTYKASQLKQNLTQDLKEILKLRRREELKKFQVCTSTPSIIFRVLRNMLTFVKCFEKVNDLLESKAKDGVKYSDIKSELEAFKEQNKDLLVSKRIQQVGMRLYAQVLNCTGHGDSATAMKEKADTMVVRQLNHVYGEGFSEDDFIMDFKGDSEALTTQLTIMINELYEGKDNGVTYEDITHLVDVLGNHIGSEEAVPQLEELVEIMNACKSGHLMGDVTKHMSIEERNQDSVSAPKGLMAMSQTMIKESVEGTMSTRYQDLVEKIATQQKQNPNEINVGAQILQHIALPFDQKGLRET